ncbi:MAG: helix-turn-helix transcriptional regulator [Gordonia amarae]
METTGADTGWARLGAVVRKARKSRDFSDVAAFAEFAGVSRRVMVDVEAGSRDNFSPQVLRKVESALGWASGDAMRVVRDPEFSPGETPMDTGMVFQIPRFSLAPVGVDVEVVERLAAAITELHKSPRFGAIRSDTSKVLESAVALCWAYVVRLVEDNCVPGTKMHPAITPMYTAFSAVAADLAPSDPSLEYTQWLRGERPDIDPGIAQDYMRRWTDARRRRRRHADD